MHIAGCGGSARHVQEGTGGGGGAPASAGKSGSNDDNDKPGTGGDAGAGGVVEPGSAGAGGSGPDECDCVDGLECVQGRCVECNDDSAPRCSENAPLVCEDGAWVALDTCHGDTPACSLGSCGAAVAKGSFATVSSPLLVVGDLQLVEHGLEYLPTSCSKDQTICVTGGMYP